MCAHNPLSVKYFHGVSAGNTYECSLKSHSEKSDRFGAMMRSSSTGMKENQFTAFAHYRIIRWLRVQDHAVLEAVDGLLVALAVGVVHAREHVRGPRQ